MVIPKASAIAASLISIVRGMSNLAVSPDSELCYIRGVKKGYERESLTDWGSYTGLAEDQFPCWQECRKHWMPKQKGWLSTYVLT